LSDICKAICKIDPDNTDLYIERTNAFSKELDSLHDDLFLQLQAIKDKPIYTAHNSFAYFFREFELEFGGVLEEKPGKEISPKYYACFLTQVRFAKVNYIFSEPQLNVSLIN